MFEKVTPAGGQYLPTAHYLHSTYSLYIMYGEQDMSSHIIAVTTMTLSERPGNLQLPRRLHVLRRRRRRLRSQVPM